MMLQVRDAAAADWPTLRELLLEARLPVEDLGPGHMRDFIVAQSDDGDVTIVAGSAGLQVFGDVALLRSLVVVPAQRGQGAGRQLVNQLERRAEKARVSELWLLTLDAAEFFERLGFERVDRATAPDAIRHTDEFRSLCPGNAVLMRKRTNRR